MGQHNAEDIVQSAYLSAWANREKVTQDFDRWFAVIVHNAFISHARSERRRGQAMADAELPPNLMESPEQLRFVSEAIDFMVSEIETARKEVALILRLHFLHHLSITEIATVSDYSRAYANRIVNNFKEVMGENGFGDGDFRH